MIDLGCKDIDSETFLKCGLGISHSEYSVLSFLLKQSKGRTVADICKALELDRTTVQKAVRSLKGKNIVNRKKENREKGGYEYIYLPREKKELSSKLLKNLDNWYALASKRIQEIL